MGCFIRRPIICQIWINLILVISGWFSFFLYFADWKLLHLLKTVRFCSNCSRRRWREISAENSSKRRCARKTWLNEMFSKIKFKDYCQWRGMIPRVCQSVRKCAHVCASVRLTPFRLFAGLLTLQNLCGSVRMRALVCASPPSACACGMFPIIICF